MAISGFGIRVRAGSLILQDDSVLLVEFDDEEAGLHYNLPAGGVEIGESIHEAVAREAREEASIDVEVGPLAFVYEYMDAKSSVATHGLSMIFDCRIIGGTPQVSATPDLHQTGVKWIPLSELQDIVLFPDMRAEILEYARSEQWVVRYLEDLAKRVEVNVEG